MRLFLDYLEGLVDDRCIFLGGIGRFSFIWMNERGYNGNLL